MCLEEYKNFKQLNKFMQAQIITLLFLTAKEFLDGEITQLVKFRL